MANPNPSPSTRFSAANPGGRAKQKGARDRLTAAFLTAVADDFETHGKAVVEKVRSEDPGTYLRICASLAPKEVDIKNRPLEELSDETLAALIEHLRSIVPPEAEAPADEPGKPRTVN